MFSSQMNAESTETTINNYFTKPRWIPTLDSLLSWQNKWTMWPALTKLSEK